MRKLILFLLLFLVPASAPAFELLYPVTIKDKTWRYVVILPGTTIEGTPYMDLFDYSVQEWNHRVGMTLSWESGQQGEDPCARSFNSVSMIEVDVCFDYDFPYAAAAGTFANILDFTWSDGGWRNRGEAGLTTEPYPSIIRANIFLATRNGVPQSNLEFSASSTLTHEIGHNLGLAHSTITNSLMSLSGSEPFNHDNFNGLPTLDHDSLCGVFFLNDEHERCSTFRPAATTDGSRTWAEFHSYASGNGGHAEQSIFNPAEELDAYGTIVISPPDWEKPGSIHVVAMYADGSLAFRLENSEWSFEWTGGRLPISYRHEALDYAHDFQIAGLNFLESRLERERRELGLSSLFEIIAHFEIPIEGISFTDTTAAWDYVWHYLRSQDPNYASGEKWGFGDGDSIAFYIAYSTDEAPEVYHYSAEPLIITWSSSID